MRDIGLEHLRGSAFGSHPGVLDLVPKVLDAVELGAVRGQKVERETLSGEQFDEGTQPLCGVNRGVVEDDGQRLGHMLIEQPQEAYEEVGSHGLPERGSEEPAARQQGSHDVQALVSLGFDEVALAFGRPGTAIGMHRGEARFVDVGQHDVTVDRLLSQRVDLYACLSEGRLVTAFFEECRVRFHTKPEALSVATKVLR